MNRPVFGKKTLPSQRGRVDRFVNTRDSTAEMRRRRSWHAGCDRETVDIWQIKHQQQRKYKSYLDEAFGLEPRSQECRSGEEEYWVQPWPCAPRKRSFLSSADSILDLPTYRYAPLPELLDWSSKNILVAALGWKYHMFSWRAQAVMGQGKAQYDIQCCKFDPRGDLLLIGTHMKTVELHHSAWSKWIGEGICVCSKFRTPCSITAVDWSPTGNSFVTGCSRGVVTTFDRTALIINTWRGMSRVPILAVKVSPDARYVAAATVNSPLVHVLVWPYLQYHSSLKSNWTVKTITWHPWRSALLGVGAVTPNLQTTIALWDTPSARLRKTDICRNHYTLDVMLFSHRTGELVLSLWNADRASTDPKTCSQLVVMSDPYTVVDQSGEGRSGLDRVRTMVFSPDGTKLATATADEDLIIWNFLPEEKNKNYNNTKSRRFSAIPSYLDQITQGYVLR